jgi:hypothetical protein
MLKLLYVSGDDASCQEALALSARVATTMCARQLPMRPNGYYRKAGFGRSSSAPDCFTVRR